MKETIQVNDEVISKREQYNKREEEFSAKYFVSEEEFWKDISKEVLISLKRMLELNMEEEVANYIGAIKWQHKIGRVGYRNGYYSRDLMTSFGMIDAIKVPRIRDGEIKFNFIGKYKRRTREVDNLILNMFLEGVSTRRVEDVLKPFYGQRVASATLVSKVTQELNSQVEKYHNRNIEDKYEYLIFDGIWINTKSPVYKRRRCVMVAYGLWEEKSVSGKNILRREIIDFKMAYNGESQSTWENFMVGLKMRGLFGKKVKLITVDGNKGLCNAVRYFFPQVLLQRCWAHKLRNVANKLPKKLQSPCISQARDIYSQKSIGKAIKAYKHWASVWQGIAPNAVKCVESDLEELLNFYYCPEHLFKKLRTSNVIERVFREVRRRIRPMSCFNNRQSVERIVFAIFNKMNKKYYSNYQF